MDDLSSGYELNKAFVGAVKSGDAPRARALLEQGADPDARLAGEGSPLFMAVSGQNYALTAAIAEYMGDVDLRNDCDFTPFTLALRLNRDDIAGVLLERGAKPFPDGPGSCYGLDWAIENKSYAMIRRMLETAKKPDIVYRDSLPLLAWAAEKGDAVLAETCLDAGADIGRGHAETGATALHHAARRGDEPVIRLLMERGADPSIESAGGTPLDWALAAGKEDAMRGVLVEFETRGLIHAITKGTEGDVAVGRALRLRRKDREQG